MSSCHWGQMGNSHLAALGNRRSGYACEPEADGDSIVAAEGIRPLRERIGFVASALCPGCPLPPPGPAPHEPLNK